MRSFGGVLRGVGRGNKAGGEAKGESVSEEERERRRRDGEAAGGGREGLGGATGRALSPWTRSMRRGMWMWARFQVLTVTNHFFFPDNCVQQFCCKNNTACRFS